MAQKLLLKKRGMIESGNDILKSVCDIEHTRHRSPINAASIFSQAFVLILFLTKKAASICFEAAFLNYTEYDSYLYWAIMPFANSTICFRPSSGRLPFLNSARTLGSLLLISRWNCSSNAFTCFTGSSRNNPCVPR